MPVTTLPELLVHELGDLLFAERTILKALKNMIREISLDAMRARLEQHYTETEQQIDNLESAFAVLGERAKAQRCPGILGILKEHDDFKQEEAGSKPILEAFDLGAGLRVENYEIAAYRSAIAVARNLGIQEVIDVLQRNLDQELSMAAFIESNAAMALETVRANVAATRKRATKRAVKRGAVKRGAVKRGAKKSTAKKSGARKTAKKGGAKRARR